MVDSQTLLKGHMLTKILIAALLLACIPLVLALLVLWYPVAAILRFAERDVPYPHEHMAAFLKGERLHVH